MVLNCILRVYYVYTTHSIHMLFVLQKRRGYDIPHSYDDSKKFVWFVSEKINGIDTPFIKGLYITCIL